MKTYNGGCHCGAVTLRVEADITEAIRCNCSHCKRKGMLLAFVPKSQVNVTGGDTMTTYLFNKKVIQHKFCPICGVQPFGESGDTMAINLNCIDDTDLDHTTLTIKEVDGKQF